MSDDVYAGYNKLREGRIHLWCPECGRKCSNAPRAEYDPPAAHLMHVACENCSMGCKDGENDYLDAKGRWLDWETGKPWK